MKEAPAPLAPVSRLVVSGPHMDIGHGIPKAAASAGPVACGPLSAPVSFSFSAGHSSAGRPATAHATAASSAAATLVALPVMAPSRALAQKRQYATPSSLLLVTRTAASTRSIKSATPACAATTAGTLAKPET